MPAVTIPLECTVRGCGESLVSPEQRRKRLQNSQSSAKTKNCVANKERVQYCAQVFEAIWRSGSITFEPGMSTKPGFCMRPWKLQGAALRPNYVLTLKNIIYSAAGAYASLMHTKLCQFACIWTMLIPACPNASDRKSYRIIHLIIRLKTTLKP